jgi:hypothetical protein
MYVIFYQSFNLVANSTAILGTSMVLRNQWTERLQNKEEVYKSVERHLPLDESVSDQINTLVSGLSLIAEVTASRVGKWELNDTVLQVQVIKVS